MEKFNDLGLVVAEKGDYEDTSTILKKENKKNGLGSVLFMDRYKQICSLQDSSLATEAAIWLGVINTGEVIEGAVTRLPNEDVRGRMHLTQGMVKQLLPILQEFAKTGKYIGSMKMVK